MKEIPPPKPPDDDIDWSQAPLAGWLRRHCRDLAMMRRTAKHRSTRGGRNQASHPKNYWDRRND